MAGETFELKFNNNSENYRVTIDEPINFATVDFQLSQKDKGYGRDVSFNGGEVQFEFVKYRNHYLDKLLLYNNTYGFESIVELIITCNSITTIIGELDFATAVTDDLEYFKCKVIQQSSKQIVKRRKAVKVDLLSSKDIDGNYIAPLVPENTLLLSKPIYAVSKWESSAVQDGSGSIYIPHYNDEGAQNLYSYVTLPNSMKLHGIENAFFPLSVNTYDGSNITYITAATDLKNIVITIPAVNIKWRASFYPTVLASHYVTYKYIIEYGGAVKTQVILKTNVFNTQNEEYSFNEEFKVLIPSLPFGESINIYEYFDINQGIANQFYSVDLYPTVGIQTINIEAETDTFNSIAPSFRLVDVMRQVVKSISGLDISAPRFEISGDFYDNRLLNGNSLRAISDKPFYVSLEDLEKSLVELNVDWEIDADGKIFFGIEDDFYTNNEVKVFPDTQFSSFNKSFNPRFSINEFNYGYKNFQSLKENEEPNSADVIHGESKWVLQNKMVENKKEISIEWTRDSFLIETTRRKALSENVTDDTASQDDDKLFALDTFSTASDVTIFQQYYLLHEYDPTLQLLSLKNQSNLNFLVTGINQGTYFEITTGTNANVYTVYDVSNYAIRLQKVSGSITPTSAAAQDTIFKYILIKSEVPYTNYTDSGFTNVTNLIASGKYSNLRYSVRRNIENYWKKYIATCNLYHKTQGLSSTWYKNNKDFTATYAGLTLKESDPIITEFTTPNLTPFMYNDVVFANVDFADFIALQDSLRSTRGYIKTYDNNGLPILLYPMSMKYENLSKELTIKAEEKYPDVVEEGLVLNLNAGNPLSYPGTGITWTDLSGNNNNGTLLNGLTFDSGNGGSIVFDGTDDYINCGNSTTLQNQTFTYCLWIFPQIPTGVSTLIGFGALAGGSQFRIESSRKLALLRQNVTPFTVSTGTINYNEWNYVCVSYLNPNASYYINGVNAGTASSSQTFTFSDFWIGNRALTTSPEIYKGKISQVQVYDKVLTPTEVLSNFNATKARYGL